MRRSFLFVIAFVVAACGGKVFVDSPTGGGTTGSVGGHTGVGGSGVGGVGASAAGGSGDGGSLSCFGCACSFPLTEGGCADICAMGLNGTMTPNFCDGSPALAQCAACIADRCGVGDPTDCTM